MIWRRARLLDRPGLFDVAVSGAHIATVRLTSGRADDESIDLDGRFLLPGLWDAHVHFDTHVALCQGISVAGASSAEIAAAHIATALPAGHGLVFAHGFRSAAWPAPPTVSLLDAVSAHRPIVVLSGDLHGAWLNSAALRHYGYPAASSGHLLERDAFDVESRVLRELSEQPGAVSSVAARAASRGVVGIVDYEMRWRHDAWFDRMASGFCTLRVECGTRDDQLDRLIETGWRSGEQRTELLSVGSVKVIGDGSLSSRTAWCHEGYCDAPGTVGQTNIAPDELARLLSRAARHGITAAVHAIGDRAVTNALDAFEASGATGSVEHAQLVATSDLPRFAALGVIASMQPSHLVDDWDVADRLWADRTHRAFPIAALRGHGTRVIFGSDAPVAPLDPWRSIAVAVHRRPAGEPWHAEQAIDLADALSASARSSIDPGQPADLIAIDQDPRRVTPAEFAAMPVAYTMVAGRITHAP